MSQSIEHAPSGPLVAPTDGDARHPVWSVYRPILEHQLDELRNLSNPQLTLTMDVGTLATDLIRGLVQGWDQKTLCKRLTPPVCDPIHRVVFRDFTSWVFATQGILSHIYQPIISQRVVDAGHDPLQRSDVVTERYDQIWGPPVFEDSILVRLPNELFDQVLENLSRQDVNDVRLTCRGSRKKAFDFWSKACFSTRHFMIDGYSLQTLLDISRHPKLRLILTHLVIGVDEIDTEDTLEFIQRSYATSPTRVATMFRYWRDAALAQRALLHTGKAAELLSQALSNLTELKVVRVAGSIYTRYIAYDPMMPRYPDLFPRSYGAWAYQMQRRNISDARVHLNSAGFQDKVFSCVLNSLVRSSPVKLLMLRTNLHQCDTCLKDEAFYLPPFASFPTENLTFLARITTLHLDLNLESRSIRRTTRLGDHQHTFDPCNSSLRQFLRACSSLESLSLRLPPLQTHANHCDFTVWLAATADNPIDTPVYWPFLRKLVLMGLRMSPATLRNIFVKFDTVKAAILRSIILAECFLDHPPIPQNSQEQLQNLWTTFLRGSAAVLSNLESLELAFLFVERYREDPVEFVRQRRGADDSMIVFAREAPRASLHPKYSYTVKVTDSQQEALETLAEQTWLLKDWKRAQDAANAAADDEA